ncbi:MAG: hypothetical protein J6L71_04425 [Clostridia bacterium]|nr:hypothetical protein [Clostridia bacterium]
MKKNQGKKRAEMLLLDLEANKSSLEYYRGLVQCGGVPVREAGHVAARIKYLTHIIASTEHALSLLTPTELDIITKLFLNKELTFDDVCESCALERSSIYRYRTSALTKISKAIYGTE